MPEKIFDIFPPESSLSVPKIEKRSMAQKLIEKKTPEKPKVKKPFPWLIFLIFVILVLGVGVFGFITPFFLSRTQIEIWPKMEDLSFKERIEINTKKEQTDLTAKIFPGKIFELPVEKSEEFLASGKTLKTVKAQGQIRVYNAYSTSSQTLITNTRFISAEGKLFRSLEKVTIPGGSYDGKGKLVPGFLDIKVTAAEAGPEYNIRPSTFSIPGFAGTSKYTAFYGKSLEPMTGGFQGESPQVTQEDLDKAKETLSQKLFEEEKANLRNRISPDFILLERAQNQEIIESVSSVQAGAEVQNFNFRIKGVLKIFTFKKSDLENFAKAFIIAQMPEDETSLVDDFWSKKKIQEESLKMNYEIYSVNWKEEKIILDLNFSAKIYSDIEETTLKKALFGKSLKEARIILNNQPQVEKSEIKSWPFWVKRIPQKESRIEVELNLGG